MKIKGGRDIMITIFKAGEYDYSDLGVNKPVCVSVENLEEIAKKTAKSDITDEHGKDVIGFMDNFVVEDGVLKANKPMNLELKGKGFSPEIVCDFIDYDDYFGIVNVSMPRVGFTKNPRNKILYNSINNSSDGENMSDRELRKVIREKDDLQEQIGVLKNEKKQLTRLIEQQKKEIEDIKETNSEYDEKIKKLDDLKEKADSYDELMETRREELVEKIVGKDSNLAKKYDGFSVEQLDTIIETKSISRAGQGVTPQNAQVDQGDKVPADEGDEYSWEEFEADFKASGL